MSYEEKNQEENGSTTRDDALPFHKLLSYGDSLDWVLMGLGTFGSLLHGMAQPIGYLLLGKALNAFGNNITDLDAMVHALYQVYLLFFHSFFYDYFYRQIVETTISTNYAPSNLYKCYN